MKKIFIGILVVLCLVVIGLIIHTVINNNKEVREDLGYVDFNITSVHLACADSPSFAYEEDEEGTTITICRGTKPTGGYDLDVKKVKYSNDTLYVYVKDTNPRGIVTQALTSPTASIYVKKKAKHIVIKGNEDYKEYKKEQS